MTAQQHHQLLPQPQGGYGQEQRSPLPPEVVEGGRQLVFLLAAVGVASRTGTALQNQHIWPQPPQGLQGQPLHQTRVGHKEIPRVKHPIGTLGGPVGEQGGGGPWQMAGWPDLDGQVIG